jgi:hypothetical protein
MGSIVKMNFEENENLKYKLKIWSWKLGLKIEFRGGNEKPKIQEKTNWKLN